MTSDRVRRRVEALLDEAERAIEQDDWDSVLRKARAVLRIDPWNQDGLTYYAGAARAHGFANDRPDDHPPRPIRSGEPLTAGAQPAGAPLAGARTAEDVLAGEPLRER